MLIKAINLNLKIARNYILATAFMLAASTFIGGILLVFVVGIVAIKGYCKLFCDSVYQDEASLYITLPINAEISLWGKVLACIIWNLLLGGIGLISLLVVSLFLHNGDISIWVETYAKPLIAFGMRPLQVAIYIGLIPFSIMVSTGFVCFFIVTVQSFLGKKGRRKGYVVVLAIILSGVISFALNKVVDLSSFDYFSMQMGLHALYIVLIGVMYWGYKKNTSKELETI